MPPVWAVRKRHINKSPRHDAERAGGFSYKAEGCGSSPPWEVGYLVEQLVVCKTAHRQLCALTGVGEGKEGVIHAQRQHTVDVQGGLTELGAEHEVFTPCAFSSFRLPRQPESTAFSAGTAIIYRPSAMEVS